uniref:Secreted protein n=1 Tax=Salix viminalis TaxID=40686 RepID=A0A6N2LCD0_SALVM
MGWMIWTLMRICLLLPKGNTTAAMLVNYQMPAVEMCRQSILVVAFSGSQFALQDTRINTNHIKHHPCNLKHPSARPAQLAVQNKAAVEPFENPNNLLL